MTTILRKAVLSAAGIGAIAVAVATFAYANIGDADISGPFKAPSVALGESEGVLMPAPVTGVELFTADAGTMTPACLPASAVADRFSAEKARIGGETVMLGDGLEQSFADTWRREVAEERVKVSTVIAHVFADSDGPGALADVVEFDANGCAMSRTILSGSEFDSLLVRAAGRDI